MENTDMTYTPLNRNQAADDEMWEKIHSYQMSPEDIIKRVTEICRRHNVKHLFLFGSYAAGNPTRYSDMDFVVKGVPDISALEEETEEIPTLIKIDLFDYDNIHNQSLKKDIDLYAKKIY